MCPKRLYVLTTTAALLASLATPPGARAQSSMDLPDDMSMGGGAVVCAYGDVSGRLIVVTDQRRLQLGSRRVWTAQRDVGDDVAVNRAGQQWHGSSRRGCGWGFHQPIVPATGERKAGSAGAPAPGKRVRPAPVRGWGGTSAIAGVRGADLAPLPL